MYAAGETVRLFADIFPAGITPWAPGLPTTSGGAKVPVKLRAIISERCLTLGWRVGSVIHRVDLEMTEEQTAEATFRGGPVGDYQVTLAAGCKCGAGSLSSWVPFPGVIWVQEPRVEQYGVSIGRDTGWGLPSRRYSRTRL